MIVILIITNTIKVNFVSITIIIVIIQIMINLLCP